MFIMAKRNIELPSKDDSQKHKVAKGFIGNIPDWAAETPYFAALVQDGKIVVPASKKDSEIADAAGKKSSRKKQPKEERPPEEKEAPQDEEPPEEKL